ncbi:hypothetical protein [Frankia sp. R82]|uniref:hypothetical protein n=1 Tax=Frankia sp. R82 TaxID=2950553 RepID=UPI002043DC10|nr:hypothetical protein [Frankia sp. R82]MCM3885615.1 hypothetical protein [Frankia sp. R82]
MEEDRTVASQIPRKRADEGKVRLNTRDLRAIEWIFDMYAAFETDIPEILDPDRIISRNATRSIVTRWVNAGVAHAEPVLANQGRLVRLTSDGEQFVSTSDGAPAAPPGAPAAAVHHAMVARARLSLERNGVSGMAVRRWLSERQWRIENEHLIAAGGHVPDGIIYLENGRSCVLQVGHTSVEVARIRSLLEKLLENHKIVVVAIPGDVMKISNTAWEEAGISEPTADGDGVHVVIV